MATLGGPARGHDVGPEPQLRDTDMLQVHAASEPRRGCPQTRWLKQTHAPVSSFLSLVKGHRSSNSSPLLCARDSDSALLTDVQVTWLTKTKSVLLGGLPAFSHMAPFSFVPGRCGRTRVHHLLQMRKIKAMKLPVSSCLGDS